MRLTLLFEARWTDASLLKRINRYIRGKEYEGAAMPSAENILNVAKELDIDLSYRYLDWIVKMITTDQLTDHIIADKLESGEIEWHVSDKTLARWLELFKVLRHKPYFTDSKDINSYKTVQELSDAIIKTQEEAYKRQGIDNEYFSEGIYTAVELMTENDCLKFGAGTQLCTSMANHLTRYIGSDKTLYGIYKANNKFAQFSIKNGASFELRDIQNKTINNIDKDLSNLVYRLSEPYLSSIGYHFNRIKALLNLATWIDTDKLYRQIEECDFSSYLNTNLIIKLVKVALKRNVRWNKIERFFSMIIDNFKELNDLELSKSLNATIVDMVLVLSKIFEYNLKWNISNDIFDDRLRGYLDISVLIKDAEKSGRNKITEDRIIRLDLFGENIVKYARNVIRGRWKEVEGYLLGKLGNKDWTSNVLNYGKFIGGWPELERKILDLLTPKYILNPELFLSFIMNYLTERSPKFEDALLSQLNRAYHYYGRRNRDLIKIIKAYDSKFLIRLIDQVQTNDNKESEIFDLYNKTKNYYV